MFDFLQAVQGYHRTVIDYFHDKDAFGSHQWFASDKRAVDWWDLPQFHFNRVDVWNVQRVALPELVSAPTHQTGSVHGDISDFDQN